MPVDDQISTQLASDLPPDALTPTTKTLGIAAEIGCTPVLALRPKEACRALGIGERLLWSLTNQRLIPHLRLGKAIVYPVDALREWLAQQAEQETRR